MQIGPVHRYVILVRVRPPVGREFATSLKRANPLGKNEGLTWIRGRGREYFRSGCLTHTTTEFRYEQGDRRAPLREWATETRRSAPRAVRQWVGRCVLWSLGGQHMRLIFFMLIAGVILLPSNALPQNIQCVRQCLGFECSFYCVPTERTEVAGAIIDPGNLTGSAPTNETRSWSARFSSLIGLTRSVFELTQQSNTSHDPTLDAALA